MKRLKNHESILQHFPYFVKIYYFIKNIHIQHTLVWIGFDLIQSEKPSTNREFDHMRSQSCFQW